LRDISARGQNSARNEISYLILHWNWYSSLIYLIAVWTPIQNFHARCIFSCARRGRDQGKGNLSRSKYSLKVKLRMLGVLTWSGFILFRVGCRCDFLMCWTVHCGMQGEIYYLLFTLIYFGKVTLFDCLYNLLDWLTEWVGGWVNEWWVSES
jgi:hypothetical protein